jgi:arsenate reductase
MARSKQTILFICLGNDARSQIAEGIVNHFHRNRYEAFSAGTEPTKVDPIAVKVMKEIGVDIGKAKAKDSKEFYGRPIDYVVTLSNEAEEDLSCFVQGKDYIHEDFPDPSGFDGPESKVIGEYRRLRDSIRAFISETFGGR